MRSRPVCGARRRHRDRPADGADARWQVAGGFFEVSANTATVLADSAEGAKG